MVSMFTRVAWLRTVVLVWTMTWTIVVPLFHVHPEADHRHGNDHHTHGGTIHAVFSPDLECEYTGYVHDLTCPKASHQHLEARVHAGHAASHTEIEFSLLSGPNDRPTGRPGISVSVLSTIESSQGQRTVSPAPFQAVISPAVRFLSTALPLRAPPSQSI